MPKTKIAAKAHNESKKPKTVLKEKKDKVMSQKTKVIKKTAPAEGGMMIINPPYGDRIEKDDIVAFYKSIGDTLKKQYSGWQAWVLSANLEALKFVGLRPSRNIPLFNGPLECRFNRFDLYAGSKKGGGEPREVKEEGQA